MKRLLHSIIVTFPFVIPNFVSAQGISAQGTVDIKHADGKTTTLPMEAIDTMRSDSERQTVSLSYSTEEIEKVSFADAISKDKVNLKAKDKVQPFNQLVSLSVATGGSEFVVPFGETERQVIALPDANNCSATIKTTGVYVYVNEKLVDGSFELKDAEYEIKVVAYNGDVRTYSLEVLNNSTNVNITAQNISGEWSAIDEIAIDGKQLGAGKIKAKGGSYDENEKNNFNLKFEEKQDILGIIKNKRWTIEGNAGDGSCIRSVLGAEISKQIAGGEWTPQVKNISLNFNGKYAGCYTLSETPRVCKGRVENGAVMCIDNGADEGDNYFVSGETGMTFIVKDPETGMDGAMIFRIRDKVAKLEKAMKAKDWSAVHSILDVESMAKWTVANEVAMNDKAFGGDTYIYYGEDCKLHFITSVSASKAFNANSGTSGYTAYGRGWCLLLQEDKTFVSAVKTALASISANKLSEWIEKSAKENKGNALANNLLWHSLQTDEAAGDAYDNEINNLKKWLTARLKWLADEWK